MCFFALTFFFIFNLTLWAFFCRCTHNSCCIYDAVWFVFLFFFLQMFVRWMHKFHIYKANWWHETVTKSYELKPLISTLVHFDCIILTLKKIPTIHTIQRIQQIKFLFRFQSHRNFLIIFFFEWIPTHI